MLIYSRCCLVNDINILFLREKIIFIVFNIFRKTTSKGLSLAMSWTWANTGLDLDQLKLYAALHNGADIFKGVDCEEKYPISPTANSCKIFDWQKNKMSLSFDSNELPESTQENPPKHEEL